MQRDNYLEYVRNTLRSYSINPKKKMLEKFIEKNIIVRNAITGNLKIAGEGNNEYLEGNLDEVLDECLKDSNDALKEFEINEFIKDYKHSVLFESELFNNVLDKIEKEEIIRGTEEKLLFSETNKPVFYKDDERIYMKFSKMYSAIHPTLGTEILLKYPIIVVFHKKLALIEFRFDILKRFFLDDNDNETYCILVDDIKKYIEEKYNCKLVGVDLDFMITACKNSDDIKLIAQFMKLSTGGSAQLEVGDNKEYVLPLIGELRDILIENEADLAQVPKLKDILEQFMYEKEEMSDYPWIEVLWKNDIKTRSIHIKIIFDYMNKGYGLIKHYYSSVLVGMERMNYVVEYISNNRQNNTN